MAVSPVRRLFTRHRLKLMVFGLAAMLASAGLMTWVSQSWAAGLAAFGGSGGLGLLWWESHRTRLLARQIDQRLAGLARSVGRLDRRLKHVESDQTVREDHITRLTAATGIATAQVKDLIGRYEKDRLTRHSAGVG